MVFVLGWLVVHPHTNFEQKLVWGYTLPYMKKEYGMYAAMAIAIALLVTGIWWTQRSKTSDVPAGVVATSTDSIASTSSDPSSVGSTPSPVATQKPTPTPKPSSTAKPAFSLVPGDEPASWYFVGTYSDGGQLEARADAEIERMKNFLNSGTFTNYELYVSIANQYELLGDGKQQYTYLNYALAIDSTKTGLAWHNMGKLLEKLGSYKSARVAYDRMIQVQPTSQYIRARLEFLKAHMSEDTDAIKQAEADLAASGE